MNHGEFKRRTAGGVRAAVLAASVVGLVVVADVQPLTAREVSSNSQPSQTVTAYLDYREADYDFAQWSLTSTKHPGPFKKEPPFGRDNLSRGMLQMGGGGSNELAFAWDRTAGKLYLDLNRNLDLTDDPAGVFSSERGRGLPYQTFTNVHLPVRTAAGDCQALVDLNFYGFGGMSCSAAMRSFWQGKVTLQGVEWEMGLLASPFERRQSLEGGSLLMRPWTERSQRFSLYGGLLEAFPFSRKLFVGNHAYELQCNPEGQGSVPRVRVKLTEQKPSLGELKITGDFVNRVTLEGGPYMVVIDKPAAVVKVPVGSYRTYKASLRKGVTEAHPDDRTQSAAGRIAISDRQAAILSVGGPLTNSVSVSRQGKNLLLNYRLVGAAGTYELGNMDRSHPPEFAVYQGDKRIASGRFEFG
jgi:hypothetical protein